MQKMLLAIASVKTALSSPLTLCSFHCKKKNEKSLFGLKSKINKTNKLIRMT